MAPSQARLNVCAMAAAGHAVGNHTFRHPLLIFEPAAQTRAELVDCQQAF